MTQGHLLTTLVDHDHCHASGMGMPTTAKGYVMASAVAAPAMVLLE